MADAATQSPYVSSSSAAGQPEPGVPHPAPGARDCKGAGSPFCADSFSASPPVALFTASQAGAVSPPPPPPPPGAVPEAPAAQGSPGAAAPEPAGSEGKAGPAAAREASASPPAAGKEQDSPESPFELILDRAAFDREFAEALPDGGRAARGEPLAKIPEDGVCDFAARPRAGGSAKGPGPARQPPGTAATTTAAALEEVSKCVREMHSFTSELLHWDLAENAERGAGGNGNGSGAGRAPPPAPKADGGWPGATDDADSSGESDDTVIEDAAAPGKAAGASSPLPEQPAAEEEEEEEEEEEKRVRPGAEGQRRDGGAGSESFVAFMRECLKSTGAGGPEKRAEEAPAGGDLEQERLTIRALRELGEEGPRGRRGEAAGGRRGEAAEGRRLPPEPRAGSAAERALARLLAALSARDLVLWRDARRSGWVLGATLPLLLSLAAFSAVSVVAHLVLALLSVTVTFRVYKAVVQAVQKSQEGHPFRAYLELDLTLSPEAFRGHVAAAAAQATRALRLLLRLFLVEDLVDSLKLAVAMWLMTYVGAVFNGITLLILAELLAFTLPPVYEKYEAQIDGCVAAARERGKALLASVQAKLPGQAGKKPE